MGSFFEKKNKALGKKSASNILTVNRYEDPVEALELVSHICSAPEAPNLADCFKEYYEAADEFDRLVAKNKYEFNYSPKEIGFYSQSAIEDGSYAAGVKVAVAGGYSAGKSTFLNCITRSKKLLPTGIEPVSVVLTYLNCSKQNEDVAVRGTNAAGNRVLLSVDVLDAIRHSSANNAPVASTLRKLTVDIPTTDDYLDGIVFIDTPGYNNSASKEIGDASSDRDTALSCFNEADFIFWCADVNNGTMTVADLDVLAKRKVINEETRERTPYALVVTKANSKPREELVRVMKKMHDDCVNRFGKDDAPQAVICFDQDTDGFIYNEIDGLPLAGVFELVRSCKEGNSSPYLGVDFINWWPNVVVDDSQKAIKQADKDRKKAVEQRNAWSECLHDLQKEDHVIASDYYRELFVKLIQQDRVDYWKSQIQEKKDFIDREERFIDFIRNQCMILSGKLHDAVENALSQRESFLAKLRPAPELIKQGTVFDAIGSGNYRLFLQCFAAGVDLSETNVLGHNVLTAVANAGENSMMQFLIAHKADLSLIDANGRDALAEAAACHFRDICEILLVADPSLAAGRSAELIQAANSNDFVSWLQKEIK